MRHKIKLAILLAALACVGAAVWISFPHAGEWLVQAGKPRRAEAIIVLSGGKGRIEKASELYRQGYAPWVILSNGREFLGDYPRLFRDPGALGIPNDRLVFENRALSTYQNALYTKALMQQHGWTSALVVSSDYHMLRVRFDFSKVYRGSGIRLIYVAAPSDYRPDKWWTDPASRATTVDEYLKLAANALGIQGPEAKKLWGASANPQPGGA